MAYKFLSHLETLNIDMQAYELQNAVIHSLTNSTRPGTPSSGQIIYNNDISSLEVYNGTEWISTGGDITSVTTGDGLNGGGVSGDVTVNIEYSGINNYILTGQQGAGSITTSMNIAISDGTDEVVKYPVSALPFTDNIGTVTSIAATGSDGITVSGSPVTTSGTFNFGLLDNSVDIVKLTENEVTFGTTTVTLGSASSSIAGLTELDFATGNRTIGSSIGENSLTIGASASTVVIPGNLTVHGTTTAINSNEVNIGDSIILLNSDETGTPSENSGFEVERGTSPNVSFIWDETLDRWDAGSAYNLRANTFIGNLQGNSDTASAWETSITIQLSGDAEGSVSIDGSSNETLNITNVVASSVDPNSVTLGTDTTGDYVKSIIAGNGIDVTATGEGVDVTITAETATTSNPGIAELSTSTEAITGTDTQKVVTPKAASDLVENRQQSKRFTDQIPSAQTTYTVTHNFGTNFSTTGIQPIIVSYFDKVTGEQLGIDTVQIDKDSFEARLDEPYGNDILISVMFAG